MIHTSYFGRIVIGSRCYLLISWRIHIIGWLLCSFLLQASLSVVLADQLASFSPSIPVQFSILSSNTTCTDNVTDPVQAASSFLVEHYNLVQNVDYIIKDQYQSSSLNVTHIYLKQLINQLPIINGDAAIHVDQCGCVVAFSTSFRPIDRAAITATKEQAHANMATIRIVSPYKALAPLANLLNYTVPLEQKDEHDIHVNSLGVANAALSFDMRMLHDIPFASGSVKVQSAGLHTSDHERVLPVWSYQLATPNGYYHVQIAMDGSHVAAISNWMYNATLHDAYRVIPAISQDPRPELQRLVEDPADLSASPHGWHARQLNGQLQYSTETVGNNVYAQENKSNRSAAEQEANLEMAGQRPNGGDQLVFDFAFNSSAQDVTENQNASITNLFYLTNYLHDLFYEYGFDEVAGNFQENNWNKGGIDGDALIVNALDAGTINDADIVVPPDGEHPRMRIHIYNYTHPPRDGAFANDIVVHEYMHGVTTRLTGGPSNADCLTEGEARGMAEGWSDFAALWLQAAANATDAASNVNAASATAAIRHAPGHGLNVGTYVNPRGLRLYDYSTDLAYNPTNYALMNDTYWQQSHTIGMIWAQMLYEMYWQLVDNHGTLGVTSRVEQVDLRWGNILAMQLIIDGIKLQPCRPSLLMARDAILLAEQLRTNGQYRCAIWTAFAKRGLGVDAKPVVTNATTSFASNALPPDCQVN